MQDSSAGMIDGSSAADTPSSRRSRAAWPDAGTAAGGTGSMLEERRARPDAKQDDRSMQMTEYVLAIVALAAALLLAIVR
jgi:hypothetical protein